MQQQLTPQSIDVWHLRMGHLNHADLTLLPNMSNGLSIGPPPVPAKFSPCVACLVAKQHRNIPRFPRSIILVYISTYVVQCNHMGILVNIYMLPSS